MEFKISDETKLSQIAKFIENLSMGTIVSFSYQIADINYTKRINSSKPILEINKEILLWMENCQLGIF